MQIFETLERRALLSAVPSVVASEHIVLDKHGGLTITGTGSADHITIKQVGARVRVAVDDAIQYFKSSRIKSIAVSGGSGSDDIATNTNLGVVINGGRGNDDITSGNGDDSLIGGVGDDTLQSGDGNDSVDGDAGDDSLVTGAGDDHCDGGDGNDHLDGGAGRNFMNGEAGDDSMTVSRHSRGSHLAGGLGDDTIDTNDDASAIVDAGAGDDHVHGRFHGTGAGIEFNDDHPDPNEDNGGAAGGHGADDPAGHDAGDDHGNDA